MDNAISSAITRRAIIRLAGAALIVPAVPASAEILEKRRMQFTPRFFDLIRNYTDTVGTGNLVLGDAVAGFTGFGSALQPGDRFYYSVRGVEKPAETEVGRGTLQADGSIARDPIDGTATDFSTGTKTVALVAAAEWFDSLTSATAAAPAVATRAELASLVGSKAALLTEAGREGTFVFDDGDLSAQVAADPQQGVHAAPASDPTGASGAWVRRGATITPAMFGAAGDDSTDDAAALQAFFTYVATQDVPHDASGTYAVASGLVIDPGVFGTDTCSINFGNCRITALNAISRLVTVKDAYNCKFSGRLHLRGTGYTSDGYSAWTCDVGLYCDNVGASKFDTLNIEGFGYAAVESEKGPSQNDIVHWGYLYSKRVGSGARLDERSLMSNWSGATGSGGYGSVTQYSQFTVETLPNSYVQANTANYPDRQILVEIAGRLHFVTYIDPATRTLRVFPQIAEAAGTSGSLKYHYGGALVLRGSDSNIDTFEQVSCIAGSTALELSCLYGPVGNVIHTEASGSNMRVGASPDSVMWGANVGSRYCEGNTFNLVYLTRAATEVFIGSSPAVDTPAKDVDVSLPLTVVSGTETHSGESFVGLTLGCGEGWLYRRKRFVDGAQEALDFNTARTAGGAQVFYSNAITDNAAFTLVPPAASMRTPFGLDCAQVTVIGRGANGQATGGVTFTPPSGHSINGGSADALATFSALTGPSHFAIYFDGGSSWTIRPIAGTELATTDDSASRGAGFRRTSDAGLLGLSLGDNSIEGSITIAKGDASKPGSFKFDLPALAGGGSFGGISASNRILADAYGTVTGFEFAQTPYVGANVVWHAGNLDPKPRVPQIQSITSAATVSPTFSDDQVNITAQAVALTLANPSGTAVDGWGIAIRIKDNGSARSIAYGTQYRALGTTLPTTTVAGKTLYLGMIYNSADSKWDVVTVAQEA
jgi:hypothetical protein